MNKIWISGVMAFASFLCQPAWATPPVTGGKLAELQPTEPRNPFSGGGGPATNAVPIIMPAPVDIKLRLVEDELLSQQLTVWARQNGYKLLWNSGKDFMIYQSIYLHGKK